MDGNKNDHVKFNKLVPQKQVKHVFSSLWKIKEEKKQTKTNEVMKME
jgi:hypothetical protein